jgi:methanogenic corrinoid protein MtbC1
MGPNANSNSGRELRSQVSPLLRAFVAFDTANANRIVREALVAYPIESVCVSLLTAAFNRLSDLWNKNEVTLPEERFATNYLRGFLFSVFQQTPERANAPLVVVTCSPRETQDIYALMLAVFWRRAGARIVFLGQDVDGPALLKDVERLRPALLAVSAMTPQRIRALARIAKSIEQLPKPRPIFAYCGAVFARNPENQRKISGVYLGDDAGAATWHVRRLLGLEAQSSGR